MTQHHSAPDESSSSDNLANDPLIVRARGIDRQLTHIWMVRAFLKHSGASVEDEELADIVRDLQDFLSGVGPLDDDDDPTAYIAKAQKKLRKLLTTTEMYESIQPDISNQANFVMAARSLRLAVDQIKSFVG